MSLPKSYAVFVLCTLCFNVQNAYAEKNSTIAKIGDYMQVIVPAYAFGMAMNEPGWEGARQFAYSFAAMEATVYGLKYTVHERRPNKADSHSFPSGHTASAFSGATFIHKRYGIKRAIIPYAMAGYTAFSRVAADKHWWWDTLAGAAIGSAFSWAIVDRYDGTQVSITPQSVSFKTTF